jgi:hypothetical protein
VAPVRVARAVPRRTGASATVDTDRQLAQVIIETRLPESTRNIVLLAAKVTLRPENGVLMGGLTADDFYEYW